MNDIANDRVGPMQNPPLIRESMDDVGWNVTETAARLGCERGTLSRLLNGKAGESANMALALEDIGWGTARALDADAGELRACTGAPGAFHDGATDAGDVRMNQLRGRLRKLWKWRC